MANQQKQDVKKISLAFPPQPGEKGKENEQKMVSHVK